MSIDNSNHIKQQLIDVAKQNKLGLQRTIGLYVREGILDRLSKSDVADKFILKGASVFQVLLGQPHRPTADIDLLGFGTNEPKKLKAVFTEICRIPTSDGLNFTEISTDLLQKGKKYQGVRLKIRGNLDNISFTTQVDVGYGHIITPEALNAEFPTLLDRVPPRLKIYPKETIVAEKLEAVVVLGLRNSRLKDYYDLLYLSRNFSFEGEVLAEAINNTFTRRETSFPKSTPVGMTEKYINYDPVRRKDWKKLFQQGTMDSRPKLSEAIASIREFLLPPLQAAATGSEFNQKWTKDGGWQKE